MIAVSAAKTKAWAVYATHLRVPCSGGDPRAVLMSCPRNFIEDLDEEIQRQRRGRLGLCMRPISECRAPEVIHEAAAAKAEAATEAASEAAAIMANSTNVPRGRGSGLRLWRAPVQPHARARTTLHCTVWKSLTKLRACTEVVAVHFLSPLPFFVSGPVGSDTGQGRIMTGKKTCTSYIF